MSARRSTPGPGDSGPGSAGETSRDRLERAMDNVTKITTSAVLLATVLLLPGTARAHCDTMDGPVVDAARRALESGDPTPVLAWLRPADESEIRDAFEQVRAVRVSSPAARELADRWFFETVVRLHRAGEGFGFEGLRPAGAPVEPAILAVDQALESGSPDEAVALLVDAVRQGLLERYERALSERARAGESVEAGRRFVAAYVELTHYAERLHALAVGGEAGHGAPGPGAEAPEHGHGER